jgi:endonuclease-3
VRTVRDRLRAYYGRPRQIAHRSPLDELVLTILSQNTNDRNRDVAYARLRARFRAWSEVSRAPVAEIEEAIRPGGISRVKAERIQQVLRIIPAAGKPSAGSVQGSGAGKPSAGSVQGSGAGKPSAGSVQGSGAGKPSAGSLSLDWLADAPRKEAFEFLEALPGVGRKTAACVLLFSFDRPELPVDTHVYRVSSRLGLIRPGASFDEAHDTLRQLVDPGDVYELHVNMLRHGRRLCRPQRPLCAECPLLRLCPYGRSKITTGDRH